MLSRQACAPCEVSIIDTILNRAQGSIESAVVLLSDADRDTRGHQTFVIARECKASINIYVFDYVVRHRSKNRSLLLGLARDIKINRRRYIKRMKFGKSNRESFLYI